MSRICSITGKSPLTGNNVSHSNVKTKRRQMPNLQARTVMNPMTGQATRIMVTARGLRTLRKWMQEGRMFDLRAFIG